MHLQRLKRLIWTGRKPQKSPAWHPGLPRAAVPEPVFNYRSHSLQASGPLEAPNRLGHFRAAPAPPAAPAAVLPPGGRGALSRWRAVPVCGQRRRRGRARSPLSRPQPPPARAGRGRRGAPPGGRPGPGGARPKLILFSKPYRIKLTTANKISLHVSTVKVQNKIKLVLVKLRSSALAPFSLA